MAKNSKASIPSPSAPTWQNWSGNLIHKTSSMQKYYFAPTKLDELSGCRESQSHRRDHPSLRPRHSQRRWCQDNLTPCRRRLRSILWHGCFADLGDAHDPSLVWGRRESATLNAGVQDDGASDPSKPHVKTLRTVAFSASRMTAVVHGARWTADLRGDRAAFTSLLPTVVTTIDARRRSPRLVACIRQACIWRPRVVTSITSCHDRHMRRRFRGTPMPGDSDKSAFVRNLRRVGVSALEHSHAYPRF